MDHDPRRVQAMLARVARGELEWQAVRTAGVEVGFGPEGCRTRLPADTPEFGPSGRDVALGFLAASKRGDLREWANVLLCGPFGFDEFADTPDGERLKENLWAASFGTPITDDDRVFLERLAAASP